MHYKRNTQPLKTNSDNILDVFRRSQRLLILAVVGTFCYAFVKQSKSHLTVPSFHFQTCKARIREIKKKQPKTSCYPILEFIDESGLSETTRFEGLHGQGDGEILVFF